MALSTKNGAVLLDKDGTLLENLPYNVDPQHMRLAPGAAAGLRQLATTGRRLVVISNQPGVAFGYFPETALGAVRDRLAQLFEQQGASLAGFFYCPHHPAGTLPRYAHACTCRKPHSGLLKRAARQFGFCLRHSWMVGDILDDIEAGRRVFCRTILVDCGNETEWRRTPRRIPDYIVGDLRMAARLIVREMQPRQATGIVAAGMVPR
ncbi:MAG TPA: HAD-IIIA family hydrolase [Burkholderiaceae bacterium]|nr:HAD-IIIA family hydrolase [Burkholderiaceae bacterium]